MNILTINEDNINIVNKQNNIEINNQDDCTAFEVYPTDHDIPRGSSELGEAIWNDPTITTNYKVVASMTEEFSLWITKSRLESDVVIDWGDGTVEKLLELTPTSGTANDGQIDVLVYVAHTYEIPNKRYIVKVYGNDYCRLSHNATKLNSANRLLCRCFTDDLPVSPHLNNLGSFAYSSNRLVKVDIPSYSALFTHVINWSSTFNACYNIRYCYGFGNMFQSVYSIDNIVNGCGGLLDTDIKMRSMLFNGTSSCFNGCTNLERNVLDFFGSQLNVGVSPFTVQRLFTNCGKIHLGVKNADYEAELEKFNNGEENTLTAMKATMDANAIKLGNLLWNNKNIVWNQLASDGKTGPFSGCSAVLKSYVPTSWGGTNKLIDAEITLNKLNVDKNDYTAFEVFAHNYDIPVGDCEELGGYVSNLIPASMTHNFVLRTMCIDHTQSDVVIDWGDGETSIIAEGQYNKKPENTDVTADTANGEANYTFSHTYAENGKYIVKIYGKQYYNINNLIKPASGYNNIKSSLICRVFDFDLPLALHLNNLTSTCAYSNALLYVNAANIKYRYFINATAIFAECKNLLKAVEFKRNFINANCSSAHFGNISLRKTDMQIPFKSLYSVAAQQQYWNCYNLEVDIASLFPEVQSLVNCNFSFYLTFYECKKLYGTVPDNKLWNNKNITVTNTLEAFKGCSEEIRSQVPISWGGTASDNIIEPSIDEKLEKKVSQNTFE